MPELVVRSEFVDGAVSLVHPQSGELLDLSTAKSGEIAAWIEAIRDWESSARAARQFASAELHERMDRAASWTLRDGVYEVKGESPERVEYDVDELRRVLDALRDSGKITADAAAGAIKEEVVYKASKRGINALLKLGGAVADAVRSCERPNERPRRVTVSRSR